MFDCPTYGDTSKFANPYIPMVSNLGKLHDCGCNKCSGKYSPSKDEVRVEIAENIHPNREFLGFVGEYKNRTCEVMVAADFVGRKSPLPSYRSYKVRAASNVKQSMPASEKGLLDAN